MIHDTIRAAFFTYPSAFQNVGGGEIQLLKTKEYLEKEGVSVHLFDMWRDRVEDYDLIHIFSSVKDCLGLAQTAKYRKVPIAVSPVFWSDFRRAFFTEGRLTEKAMLAIQHGVKWIWPLFPSSRRELLNVADVILPNSEMERRQVARLFSLSENKIKVIHNAADRSFCEAKPDLFLDRHGSEPFVLGVGRIEPRKNQLNLIRAMSSIRGYRLVLIGSPVSGYEAYYEACQREGAGSVQFIPTLDHDDPLLRSAYAACALFVLQGWFETPGLAALEAALAGAKILVTCGGSTREYFGEHVDYLDPKNPLDIAKKIRQNLDRPNTGLLRTHTLTHFTWDKIAKDHVRCYRELMSKAKSAR